MHSTYCQYLHTPKATNFVLYDDANEAAGKGARRELGLVVFAPRQHGQTLPMELVLPRVQSGGASAQFRPTKVSEALLSQYRAGTTRDLFVVRGARTCSRSKCRRP